MVLVSPSELFFLVDGVDRQVALAPLSPLRAVCAYTVVGAIDVNVNLFTKICAMRICMRPRIRSSLYTIGRLFGSTLPGAGHF